MILFRLNCCTGSSQKTNTLGHENRKVIYSMLFPINKFNILLTPSKNIWVALYKNETTKKKSLPINSNYLLPN